MTEVTSTKIFFVSKLTSGILNKYGVKYED